ncbi:MAG: class I SAM-dependent rRNA methyltransferase, partial [Elusimicrobiales bacterium]|nr:class I SAM-dependent rRNA methyltransferase [Elusimicrobiales bacterium]
MKTIRLKEKYIERLNSHMWIFSNEIEKHDFSVQNGEICRIEYKDGKICGAGFYNPHSLISVRLLVKGTDLIDDNFFFLKIKEAYTYRKKIGIKESGRFFFGESDGIGGLIIDKYNEVITLEILSSGVELIIDKIKDIIKEIFNPKALVIFRDHPYRILEGLKIEKTQIIGNLPNCIIINENNAKFEVDILSSQKTGWYFDQRDNRKVLIPYFKDRKVLDLYCYTGAFSIIAAKNGAKQVWGIDSSEKSIEIAQKNAKLNNVDSKVIFKKESSLKILDALVKEELPIKPDFILLDPPNLVRNKKHLYQAKRHYIRILKQALKGVEKDGYVAFSTCSQHIDDEIFNEIITTASVKSKRKVFILYTGTQAKDHPIIAGMKETKYLRF